VDLKKPKVYLYTKFSIPVWPIQATYNINNYRQSLVNKTYDEYISYLYNSERIETKFYFFEKLTLPSIINQSYKNLEWNIFAHNLLPTKYISHLYSITNSYNNINIITINAQSSTHKQLAKIHTPSSESFVTSRIDDDDGLYYNYYELMIDSFDEPCEVYGTKECLLISKRNGSSAGYPAGLYYEKNKKPYPISCGLSIKNKHIFGLGCSHMDIDKKYMFCDIGESYSALMSCGDHTITQRKEGGIEYFDVVSYMNGRFIAKVGN